MTFTCNGESICDSTQIAQVLVTIDGNQDIVTSSGTPLCVNNSAVAVNGNKCFHLQLIKSNTQNSNTDIYFDKYFCATNAQVIDITSIGYPGYFSIATGGYVWVNLNGYVPQGFKFQLGEYDGYLYGANLQQITSSVGLPVANGEYPCFGCLGGCNVTIQDCNGDTIYNNSGGNCSTSFACDGCPTGTIQCNCNNYPGYCCLPCQAIEEEIQIMIDQATSMLLQKQAGQTTLT